MHRGGRRPVATTELPPSTQPVLQPRNSQPHNSTAAAKMQDAVTVRQPSLGNNYNSNSIPNLKPRLKELGMEGRPDVMQNVDTKRKWTPTGSESLDHSRLWLSRDQDSQQTAPLKKLSASIPVEPKGADSRSDPRDKHDILSRLFQEISQAESRQWKDIPDIKVQNPIPDIKVKKPVKKVHPENKLPERETAAASPGVSGATFRLDRNASASPSEHEDHAPPELELKRTGSVSSQDAVDVEPVQGGRGRSQSRNNNNSNNNNNFTVSKNLVSERKRRKKLNDGLYSLRALVPKISKMDKASIVGDAIEHVKELQQQIESIELEIAEMECQYSATLVDEDSGASRLSESGEHATAAPAKGVSAVTEVACKVAGEVPAAANITTAASTDNMVSLADSRSPSSGMDQKRILKMEVSKLDDRMYQLQISCQKGPGVLVQLTRALESLDIDILNAYHTSFQESILNTFIVEMKNLDVREAEDVRSTVLDAVAQHGLAAQS